MSATDIPAEWIDAGARASAEFWGDPQPDHLDERAAVAIMRAVLPHIREQIARDIEAYDKAVCERIKESCTCDPCARIAREGRP